MRLSISTITLIATGYFWCSGSLPAQTVEEDWRATHPGGLSAHVVADTDGSIYVTGASALDAAHNFQRDIVTIKYDLEGNALWVREYEPASDGFSQVPHWIAIDPFGNVLVTGQDFNDFITLKYDPEGNLLWDAVNTVGFNAVRVAADAAGNVYVAGTSSEAGTSASDVVTIKYDPEGNQEWIRVYTGGFGDEVHSLAVTAEGEVAVVGASSNGTTCFDMTTLRYGPDGTPRWVRNYSAPLTCSMDGASDVAFGPAGELYVGGHSEQTEEGQADFTLLKYDTDGNLVWVRTHNGPSNLADFINRLGVDSQGDIVVTGISEGDFLTIKYDPSGNELWSRQLGFFGSTDEPNFLLIGPDDAIYLTGYATSTQSEVATVKYDAAGQLQWNVATSTSVFPDQGFGLALDATGHVIVSAAEPIATIRYIQEQVPESDLTVEVEPVNPPVQIPPQGGTFQYTVTVENTSSQQQGSQLWFTVVTPDNRQLPRGSFSLNLAPGGIFTRTLSQKIPGRAPAGSYTFTGSVGTFPDLVADSDSFPFEKLSGSTMED